MANNSKSNYGALARARDRFSQFAQIISHATGHPMAFTLAVGVVIVWAITGPLFDFSDTWQLVINTGTTIVTFLMVFLIQNTQNRDTMALQLKLSELVLAQKGADNSFVDLENLSDAELEKMHTELCRRSEHTLSALERRKSNAQSKPQSKPKHRRARKK